MIYVVVIVQVIEDFLLKWNPLWNLVQWQNGFFDPKNRNVIFLYIVIHEKPNDTDVCVYAVIVASEK